MAKRWVGRVANAHQEKDVIFVLYARIGPQKEWLVVGKGKFIV